QAPPFDPHTYHGKPLSGQGLYLFNRDGGSRYSLSRLGSLSTQRTSEPPQTFGTPRPPHVLGATQVPQSSSPPQLSAILPQLADASAQVRGVQFDGQVPQSKRPPHPSPLGPQVTPICAQVRGVQLGAPHWFATPAPPQVCVGPQVPQF